jgi:ABC-type amino acid transport substrate-binding protein
VALLLLVGGCASSMDGAAASKTTLDRIKSSKTVVFGYREASVPFSYVGSSGGPTGYSVDLCTRVSQSLQKELQIPDLEIKWVPVTVDNRMTALQNGTIDLECGSTTNTLGRQAQVDFSLTTFITGGSLLALKDAKLGELKGLRIAVIPGTTTERALKDANAGGLQLQLVPVKDHAEGRAAIEDRKADTYASDRDILIGLAITAKDPSQFILGDRYFSYEPYALMMRRNDPDFRLAVNRALARIYRSGEIIDVYTKWFGALGPPSALQIATYAVQGLPE